MSTAFRRVVTGHDEAGRATVVSDAPPTHVVQVGGGVGPTFYEVWNTRETPAVIDRRSDEPGEDGLVLTPPDGGTRIRVIDFPPEGDEIRHLSEADARAGFSSMGNADASTSSARHPLMHRTETVDYGIVLHGELTLILDDSETTVRAGDVVIQRGTNHAWANRSDSNCRVVFVLIDGKFTAGL
jgi:mannose-6-phosphate isomerase-like protein (cupin superfamily)